MKGTSDKSARCMGGGSGGGDKVWPPGFRFHPTDEELILYYLKRKMCKKRIKLDIIAETDVYKWDPDELPGLSVLKTGDRQWFFFSPRDRKYPNGAKTSRGTRNGYWKTTGKDRKITCNSRSVGVKKTLVYYQGRSPEGKRTDWVMHEYTLDEDELKRCQNVKDYYALYKVYKKSGPGPKNGEQYGAPFNEEEWADDDYVEFNNFTLANHLKQVPTDNLTGNNHIKPPLDDIDEFVRQILDEPEDKQLPVHDRAFSIPQVIGEQLQSSLVNPSFKEVIHPESIRVLHASGQQCHVQSGFDFRHSATSQLQLHQYKASDITSATDAGEIQREDDFLEINDLIGPDPNLLNIPNTVGNLEFERADGLSEFDMFHDASMFLDGIGLNGRGTLPITYMDPLQSVVPNQWDYQSEAQQKVENEISNTWTEYYKRSSVIIPADAIHGALSQPTSGVVNESTNLLTQNNQCESDIKVGDATSSLSSLLWTFVESIPSSPASAAENSSLNQALEQSSSFCRLRTNTAGTNVEAGNIPATIRMAGEKRGFIFFSVLGAICAVLWVLIGSIGVWGRCIIS